MRRIMILILIAALFTFTSIALADTSSPHHASPIFDLQSSFSALPTPYGTRLPTPLPGEDMIPTWMTPPAPGTSQAEQGAVVYYYHCMACHGDRAQGLTVEWRAQWAHGHQDCSAPQCHGSRHPPEGFSFPKNFAPALVGSTALASYATAQDLFQFVSQRMPYQAPGSLKSDEYWQLVAFLLKRRGVAVDQIDETNAREISVHPPDDPQPIHLLLVGSGILIATAGLSSVLWVKRKR